MGTPVTNAAYFIALVTTIRQPPHYTVGDGASTADELNHEAKVSYYTLVILHFLTAIFKFSMLSERVRLSKIMTLGSPLVALWIVLICQIS